MFSAPTWISSNYQTFLKFSEKQVQNFIIFFVKFTQILFIIYSSPLKIFLKISQISAKFFQIFVWLFFLMSIFPICTVFSRQFFRRLLTFISSFFTDFSMFFKRFFQNLDKVTVEICLNFYFSLFKIFLENFLLFSTHLTETPN